MDVSAKQSNCIEQVGSTRLSERDTLLVLDLLENLPPPSRKLAEVAKAWIDHQKKVEGRVFVDG